MIANMPADTFLFYVGVFLLQFVLVTGYGIWWALQKDKPHTDDEEGLDT
ncbi:hypothetical protein [Desulfovibrio sp. An276]|nr:hypothetical protein [Desulfovibrio sp. An276]